MKPELKEGEIYVGGIISPEGITTHVILLPGDKKLDWAKAKEWAESIGGDLPSRIEQAMLYATAPDVFKNDAYWSNTLHASDSNCAWCQNFGGGNQNDYSTSSKLRARAIRRVIEELK